MPWFVGSSRHRRHDLIGIRVRHDVERIRRLRHVVGGAAVLEHRAAGVGLHEQVVVPVEAGRQGDDLILVV
jgi:hypothetical protein